MSKYCGFLCPEDLLAKVKEKTARDGRSVSDYINMLLEKDVADEPTPAKTKIRKPRSGF